MTLRDLMRELQELDQKFLDSEVIVSTDDTMDRFYLNPVVGLTADARIKETKVIICPGDDNVTIEYEDMFDNDNEDNEGEYND